MYGVREDPAPHPTTDLEVWVQCSTGCELGAPGGRGVTGRPAPKQGDTAAGKLDLLKGRVIDAS